MKSFIILMLIILTHVHTDRKVFEAKYHLGRKIRYVLIKLDDIGEQTKKLFVRMMTTGISNRNTLEGTVIVNDRTVDTQGFDLQADYDSGFPYQVLLESEYSFKNGAILVMFKQTRLKDVDVTLQVWEWVPTTTTTATTTTTTRSTTTAGTTSTPIQATTQNSDDEKEEKESVYTMLILPIVAFMVGITVVLACLKVCHTRMKAKARSRRGKEEVETKMEILQDPFKSVL